MRRSVLALTALLVFAAALLTLPAIAQQQPGPNVQGGVQVGVPAGRGGRAAEPGRGRGRNAGPPAPAP